MSTVNHLLTILHGESELLSTKWNLDSSLIAAASSDGSLIVYNKTGLLVNTLPCYEYLRYPVTSLHWRPGRNTKTKNIILATTCEGAVYHFHVSSGKILHMITLPTGVLCSDFSPDGNFFALGCDDSSIRIFDENTKSLVKEYNENNEGLCHSSRVMNVKWQNERCFWSGGWDKNIICWDIRTNRSVRHIFGPKICGEALDFYNETLISGSYDVSKQLGFWDTGSGKNIESVDIGESGDKCLIYSLQVNKIGDHRFVAIGGVGKNSGYFYDVKTVKLEGIISSIDKPVFSVDFSSNEQLLSMSSGDGSIRIFSY